MKKIVPVLTVVILAAILCLSFFPCQLTVAHEGRVLSDDQPIEGALIELKSINDNKVYDFYAVSDKDGNYTLQVTNTKHAKIEISISKSGFLSRNEFFFLCDEGENCYSEPKAFTLKKTADQTEEKPDPLLTLKSDKKQ